MAGAPTIRRTQLTPSAIACRSIGESRKLNRIAGCAAGSADLMWIDPRLSGRN